MTIESAPTKTVAPFLKWAGGKRWLTFQLADLISNIEGTYYEPFLGSAAMFFHSKPERAALSDMNAALVETYRALQVDQAEVTIHLRRHAAQHSTEHYYRVRSMQCKTNFTRAAQFIYLNRTCWTGLYRVNRQGFFNVPKGSKERVLLETDDFEEIANCLKEASILCVDFETQIDKAGAGDIVFCDPPYTVRHKHNGFVKYNEILFSWDDQVRLKAALLRAKTRGARIFLTNADHESIRTLYAEDFSILELSRFSAISSTSSSRGKYAELLIQ